jgi:hypothetical protein
VPGVVLQSDLLLDLAIVDLHWTKALHGVSGIDGLTRFPEVVGGKKGVLLNNAHHNDTSLN